MTQWLAFSMDLLHTAYISGIYRYWTKYSYK